MKILILKPSSLGDVIQALPVLRLLKQHAPQARIHWWIEQRLSGLLEDDPDLSGTFAFDRQSWTRPSGWLQTAQTIRSMQRHRFDLVIDLQGLFRSALVAWLAGGELTVGIDDPREGARAFYDHAIPRPGRNAHAVEWYLEVLRHLQVPVHNRFTWLPRRKRVSQEMGTKWPWEAHRWIVVQAGARWTTKRWPVQHFAAAVQRLARNLPEHRFVLLGSAADTEAAVEVARAAPERCLNLSGQTSLPEMVEWIRVSDLMLTNDTGPMHAAAALGKPVVAVFGPTDPRRTGPFGQTGNVLQTSLPCVPCLEEHCRQPKQLECLFSISPEIVCERVEQLLQRDG